MSPPSEVLGLWRGLREWQRRTGRLTHTLPVYTHQRAEKATVRTGALSSIKYGTEGTKKTNLRSVCLCVLREAVGIDFGSHFILVVEHQYQTLVFHSGRITAYCL